MKRLVLIALAGPALAAAAAAQAPPLEQGGVATLPPLGAHLVWVPDRLFAHSVLFDGDTGKMLGSIDAGAVLTPKPPLYARARGEIYSVDTAYSRGRRGQRVDFVTIYDPRTLGVRGEILLPTRSAESNASVAYAELLDGEAFLLSFNQFPTTSVSVVDLAARHFVAEIPVAGCAGIYPVAERRFATLCGDGTALAISLDTGGRKIGMAHGERFFDPVEDPVAMAAARSGPRWWFVSFAGLVHEIDFSGEAPRVGASWSLLTDADRAAGWRPGGLQHVALHRGSGRLYSVMHQGGPGSHKEAGPEIWVYDVAKQQRIARFPVPNLAATFLGVNLGAEAGSMLRRVLEWVVPNQGIHSIAVTQDERPLLFARHGELGAVAVLDASSGSHLRDLEEAGLAGPTLAVP
jgi:methylamine dehydrogenase heavy chain